MFRLATRSIPHIGMCAVALGASNLQPAGCFLGFGGGGEDEKAKLQAELARREAELAEVESVSSKKRPSFPRRWCPTSMSSPNA